MRYITRGYVKEMQKYFIPWRKAWQGLLVSCLLLGGALHAQPSTPSMQDDSTLPEVRSFIDFAAQLKGFKTHLHVEIYDAQSGKTREYNGTLTLHKNAYIFTTDELEIYCDGSNRWDYLPKQNEVTVVPNIAEEDEEDPVQSLQTLLHNLTEHFKIRYRGMRKATQGEALHDLSLYPKQVGSTHYTQIHLSYLAKTLAPQGITYHGRDGMRLTLTLRQFQGNPPPLPSYGFYASLHKGVKIIDLR